MQRIKTAWQDAELDEKGNLIGYVLVMASTNFEVKIDSAIKDRFGDPFHFPALTNEQRLVVVKRKILQYDPHDVKASFEEATNEEWEMLVHLIPQEKSVRYLTLDLIPEVKSQVNLDQDEKGRTDALSLKDFIDYLREQPVNTSDPSYDPAVLNMFVICLREMCEVAFYHDPPEELDVRVMLRAMFRASGRTILPTMVSMGLSNWNKVLQEKSNDAIPAKFLLQMELCVKEAFTDTYGGGYGPSFDPVDRNPLVRNEGVSAYTDPEQRALLEAQGLYEDKQMVEYKVRGRNEKGAGKPPKYIINLELKERHCQKCQIHLMTGVDIYIECNTRVPRMGTGYPGSRI